MKNLTDQQKGSLLAFVAVMFITPDSLFIRLSNVDTWGLVFYRGIIPFMTVLLGMLIIYKLNFFKTLFTSGYHGIFYVITFSVTNIKLTNKEMKISKKIGKDLKKDKIFFAGIDFIDEQLNGDINVTSPTGLKTFYDLSKINLASTFWKELKA